MIDPADLACAFVVELHPKGGSRARRIDQASRENLRAFLDGEMPEWVAVAYAPNYERAEMELARVRREMREQRSLAKGPGEEKQHTDLETR